MNRRIILVVLVLVPLLSIGQNFENNDLIGKWKVIKTEFYIEGSFIRKVSLNEDNDTIVEGPDLAPMNEVFTDMVKSMTATIMHFDNNSFTWDVRNPELKIIKKYWTIKPNTNEIIIREWENKNILSYGLMGFTIISLENNILILDSEDSGTYMKFELIRIE